MSSITALAIVLAGSLIWFALIYLKGYLARDAGWVDVGWSGGIGLAALFYAFVLDGYEPRKWLVFAMVGLWSGRLCWYIIRDRLSKGEEDGRYQMLRKRWGDKAERNFFWFFESQSILITLFSVPALLVMQKTTAGFGLWDAAGIIIWAIALFGESTADRQLAAFRSNPDNKGKVCQDGLWRYSRHPNYFFEWVYWWSYVMMMIGQPGWAWTLLGPTLMFLFLFKLTGIPHTERRALVTRGDAYREYQKTTNRFIPWLPKKKSS